MSKKTFTLQHLKDDQTFEKLPGKSSTTNGKREVEIKSAESTDNLLETPSERKSRLISIVVINFTRFVFTLGFSMALTGTYPYLLELDSTADKTFLGWVIASYPVGQLIANPLLGFMSSRLKTIRWLSMILSVIFSGSFVFYACIAALPPPRKYYLMIARFLIGITAGIGTLSLSYVTSATTMKERTFHLAFLSFSQSVAYILGPIIQAAFTPLGKEESIIFGPGLHFNMYTAPAWVSAILGLLVIPLFLPKIFVEHDLTKKLKNFEKNPTHEVEEGHDSNVNLIEHSHKKDVIALVVCIIIYSFVVFNFMFIETIATPLTMDQLAWSDHQAVARVGIVLGIGAAVVTVGYIVSGFLARKYGERKVLIGGLVFLLISPVVFFPYAGPLPKMKDADNNTTENPITTILNTESLVVANTFNSTTFNFTEVYSKRDDDEDDGENGDENEDNLGCPLTQEWCLYTPAIHSEQMIVGFFLITVGYPLCTTTSSAIYSKLLGFQRQGIWMGILLGSGSLARVFCPIIVTHLYSEFGTRASFGFVAAIMFTIFIIANVFYKRLKPTPKAPTQEIQSTE